MKTKQASYWVKLQRADDWGSVYYAIEPLNSYGCASADRRFVFAHGEEVTFKPVYRAPARTGRIKVKPVRVGISDHGHSYYVETSEVHVEHEGMTAELCNVWVPRKWAERHAPPRVTLKAGAR